MTFNGRLTSYYLITSNLYIFLHDSNLSPSFMLVLNMETNCAFSGMLLPELGFTLLYYSYSCGKGLHTHLKLPPN